MFKDVLTQLINDPQAIYFFMATFVVGFFSMALIFKCAKLASHLFYPHWTFDNNLVIAPFVKISSYKLSWLISILLMPVMMLFAIFKTPSAIFLFIKLFSTKNSAIATLCVVYLVTLFIVCAGFFERLLPRKRYKNKRQLIVDLCAYGVMLIGILWVYLTQFSL